MNTSTATFRFQEKTRRFLRALLALLLGQVLSLPAIADLQSCRARCDVEKAECLVAANDVLETERYYRKLARIGPGKIKDLFPEMSAVPLEKRAGIQLVAEWEGHYQDRLYGCEMTFKNCSMLECTINLR